MGNLALAASKFQKMFSCTSVQHLDIDGKFEKRKTMTTEIRLNTKLNAFCCSGAIKEKLF